MEEPSKLALPLELLVDPSLPLASPPPPPPSPATSVSSQASSTTSLGRKRLRQEWRSSLSTSPQQHQTLISSSSLEVEGASSTQEGIDAWRRRLRSGRTNHPAGAASSLPRWMLRHANDTSDPTLVYQLSMDDHPDRHGSDDSSSPNVDDFHPSEWTPPDSSYGAAIPIAGWIPKRIRRIIELSVSVILLALIGYLIITTSMRVERNRRDDTSGAASSSSSSSVSGGGKSNNGQLDLDDDRYMYYNNKKDEEEEEEFEQDVDDTDDYLAENGQGGNKRRLLLFSLVLDQLR